MGRHRRTLAWVGLAASLAWVAGCGVDVKVGERLEAISESRSAKRVIAAAVRDGRCQDARAVALAISDSELAHKVETTCTPDPGRRGFPTDPAEAELDVLGDAAALARNRAPNWRYMPSPEVIQFFYPKAAMRAEVEGKTTVSCLVDAQGSVKDCTVVSEAPSGQGFGDAALRVAKILEFLPARSNGEAVASRVRVPINFRMPD